MCPRKRNQSEDVTPSLVLGSLENLMRSAARQRQDLGRLYDHAKNLAEYVGNLSHNAGLLFDESVKLRQQAEEILAKSPGAFFPEDADQRKNTRNRRRGPEQSPRPSKLPSGNVARFPEVGEHLAQSLSSESHESESATDLDDESAN